MRQLILLVAMLSPVAMLSQETNSVDATPQARFSLREQASATARLESVLQPGLSIMRPDGGGQQASAPAPKRQPERSEGRRPLIEGSMVGYVDNAVVGSQIRVRFDAGFHDRSPDRSEFFYAQCACNGGDAPGPQPGASNKINFQQLYFEAEYAPVSRFSVFTEVPIRWIQPKSFIPGSFAQTTFSNKSGISDVRAGFKVAVAAAPSHSLTFQLRGYFPSGDSSQGLGTDHYSVEPSLLYFQKLSERWSVESQLGGWLPIHGSHFQGTRFAGDILFYGVGPSYQLYNGNHVRFAPVVELFGWNVRGGLATVELNGGPAVVDATGINVVNLKFGARTSIGRHSSFYVGYGRALTSDVWYTDIARAEYRYTF